MKSTYRLIWLSQLMLALVAFHQAMNVVTDQPLFSILTIIGCGFLVAAVMTWLDSRKPYFLEIRQ